jgi:TM2 domain-containing membrane protein YozV
MISNIKYIVLALFCFFNCLLHAQQLIKLNPQFLEHLMHQNLEQERLAYYHCVDFKDTSAVAYTKDIVYLAAKFNDSLLLKKYTFFAKDTSDLIYVFYGSILLNQHQLFSIIMEELRLLKLSTNRLAELSELAACWQGKINNKVISTNFYSTTEGLKKMEKKSVFLATLFSTIIPGSGKYYLKQSAEGTAALFLNVLAVAPLIETIIKIGLISTASVLSGLVFIPIYLATIYGTYISKKSVLKKLNLQLKNEVLDYCTYQLRN